MSSRPLRPPGYRPGARPEGSNRPPAGAPARKGPVARCLSRGRHTGSAVPNGLAAVDAVTAREAGLRRVRRIADAHANGEKSAVQVRRDLADALLHLRVLSLDVVEAVDQWRAANGRAGTSYVDPATGENYLLKMKDDTTYLADHPVGEIFTFSPKHDPFFVVPSANDKQRAPTSAMTPTLQARRREQSITPQKKAVLPLQPSLLRRIHRAELAMLKEAVQARVLRAGGAKPAPPLPEQKPAEPAAAASPPAAQAAPQAAPAAGPAAGEPGPFTMRPVEGTRDSIRGVFEQYVARAEPQLLATLEQWPALEPMLQDEGSSALEWFWLLRREGGAGPDKPDGLAVFRVKRASMVFGQLLHLSMTDLSWFDGALEAVKQKMFTLLPIVSIRLTLWYAQSDKGLQLDKGVEALFKQRGFKWFQLQNAPGKRGQVMESKRGKTPDFPPQPPELPGLILSSGQAWVRGASGKSAMSLASGACATNLTLASACLRYFFAKDSCEAKSASEAAAAPAKETAREGLTQALLSGELERLLATFAAASMEEDWQAAVGTSADGSGRANPSATALRAAWKLQASGAPVPGVICEGGAGSGAELVRRGTASGAFAEALEGLGVERLADDLSTVNGPQDAAFGRLFVTLDWHSVVALPDGVLELPVVSVGQCPRHHGPVLYVGTSEEDAFVVVLPWAGASLPSQDTLFATCADILRDTKPQDPAPYKTVRMPSFCQRSALRSRAIGDSTTLGMPSRPSLQVSEFGSVVVCAGREMPGRLQPSRGVAGSTFVVKKPFALCLWHTDIDELNVPLAVEFVA